MGHFHNTERTRRRREMQRANGERGSECAAGCTCSPPQERSTFMHTQTTCTSARWWNKNDGKVRNTWCQTSRYLKKLQIMHKTYAGYYDYPGLGRKQKLLLLVSVSFSPSVTHSCLKGQLSDGALTQTHTPYKVTKTAETASNRLPPVL